MNVLVTRVKLVWDRNRNRMAFLRVEGSKGESKEVVVFASTWEDLRRPVKVGDLIGIRAKADSEKGSMVAKTITIRTACA